MCDPTCEPTSSTPARFTSSAPVVLQCMRFGNGPKRATVRVSNGNYEREESKAGADARASHTTVAHCEVNVQMTLARGKARNATPPCGASLCLYCLGPWYKGARRAEDDASYFDGSLFVCVCVVLLIHLFSFQFPIVGRGHGCTFCAHISIHHNNKKGPCEKWCAFTCEQHARVIEEWFSLRYFRLNETNCTVHISIRPHDDISILIKKFRFWLVFVHLS